MLLAIQLRGVYMPTLMKVENLVKHFPLRGSPFMRSKKVVHAIDDLSFEIIKSEVLGVVGESGCGKTTLGKLLIRLVEPTSGSITFEERDILALNKGQLRKMRREMQMIFQDSAASLNPRRRIRDILSRPFIVQKSAEKKKIPDLVSNLLDEVGLSPPETFANRYPHELSGGQKQRIVVARAIALQPKFVVADEPVSSLDMSIRSQILNLIKSLQSRYGLTYLLITHDLAVVRNIATRVGVMYLGKLVELADVEDLYMNPLHPYTEALLAATPIPDSSQRKRKYVILKGEVPSQIDPPSGCRFHTRCSHASYECKQKEPQLSEICRHHYVACFLH